MKERVMLFEWEIETHLEGCPFLQICSAIGYCPNVNPAAVTLLCSSQEFRIVVSYLFLLANIMTESSQCLQQPDRN
jgi:hypothetical protein